MTTLNRLRTDLRRSAEHRRNVRRLASELADYRTPAERAELDAILAHHDTTVAELLQRV
jgi:3-methyladenine DNA glycosylase AlkC